MARRKTPARGSMGKRAAAKADREQRSGSNYLLLPDDVKMIKLKKNSNRFDIIPYIVTVDNNPNQDKGELFYQRTIYVHYNVGPEELALLCPKTIGLPCPICKDVAKMYKDPDIDDDTIGDVKAKKRELFNVIDVNAGDEEIRVLENSYFTFGKLLDEEIREGGAEYADFAELQGGLTLKIRMGNDTGGDFSFLNATRIDFEERDEDYSDDLLDDAVDLDKCLNIKTYEEIENIYNGVPTASYTSTEESEEEEEEEEELEEEEKPKKTKKIKKTKKAKKVKKEEPEEEEESEEEEEEEEEEKPKKTSSARKERIAKGKKEKTKKKSKDNPCPHGHVFGDDCDSFPDDCDSCEVWEDCIDEKES